MNQLIKKSFAWTHAKAGVKKIAVSLIIQCTTVLHPAAAGLLPEQEPDRAGPTRDRAGTGQAVKQQILQLSGSVVDEKGEPVIGTNVMVKGTAQGTITDLNGQFTLENVATRATLLISYIGYLPQEIAVQNRTVLHVVLKEDTQNLEEVIVVGYGTQRKRDLTGAISSIKTDDLPKASHVSVGQMLSGQVSGLKVMQTSAQPGGNIEFRIRGNASVNASNEPLIIIDGIPSSGGAVEENSHYGAGKKSTLNSLNPNDIASIEVLKDASSTAIYGARAANGVIIITTKRGKEGKATVTYDGSVAIQRFSEKWDVLSPRDYMLQANRYLKEKWLYENKIAPYGNKPVGEASYDYIPRYTDQQIDGSVAGTDWLGQVLRQGFIQQHNVSMSGGSNGTTYLASINYFDQAGIIKNNDYQRFTGRVNLDQKLGNHVKTGLSVSMSRNKNKNVPLGGGTGSNTYGILQLAITANPLLPVKDENGGYPIDPNNTFVPNPASMLEISDESLLQHQLASAYLEITPSRDWLIRANFGYDGSSAERGSYIPKSTLEGERFNGRADISHSANENYLLEVFTRYTKKITKHTFTAMAGYSYQYFKWNGHNLSNYDFLLDSFLWNHIGAGAAAKPSVGSYANYENLLSVYARVNYDYKQRYLLTFNIRADGSPKFARNNRWGYFPSVSVGWRVSDEDFFKGLGSVVSNFKLRGGYGATGNADLGNRALQAFKAGTGHPIGGMDQIGVWADQLENKHLKWETTKEFNFGLDYGLLDERITGSLEFYNRTVDDLLSTRPLLTYHEINEIADNIGATTSKGFEFNVNARVFTGVFRWDIGINLFKNSICWKTRDADWKPAIYENERDPLRAIYCYVSDGLVKEGENVPHMPGAIPGQIKLKDLNGYKRDADGNPVVDKHGRYISTNQPDGRLDEADMILKGSKDPGLNFGLSSNMEYRNFDLSVYLYGMLNYYKTNETRNMYSLEAYRIEQGFNIFAETKDSWGSDNKAGTRPNMLMGKASNYSWGDYTIEKADFLRVKNLTLGYTVPTQKISWLSRLRVYISADNLFVLTKYEGLDPETDSFAGYPNQRSFSFGTNISF